MFKFLPKLNTAISKFKRNQEGVAAIEFMLVAPILIVLFVGTIEVSNLVSVDRKLARITSTVADVITRINETCIETDDLNDILSAAEHIMYPHSADPTIKITAVDIAGGNANVVWSHANQGNTDAVGSTITIPNAINKNGSFLITVTVDADHKPNFAFAGYSKAEGITFNTNTVSLSETMYLRPRNNDIDELRNNCP